MLNWANRFNICCFLDSHQYHSSHSSHDCLVAAGCRHSLMADAGNALNRLNCFYASAGDWIFGHLGYDLKNEIESLQSSHPDGVQFPDLFFFVPEVIVRLEGHTVSIGAEDGAARQVFRDIIGTPDVPPAFRDPVAIRQRFSRQEYVAVVEQLKRHILKGDCYEINLCQEFFAEDATIHPLALYRSLSAASPNPFAAYYRLNDKYLLCLSPERYLKKEGRHILSQPIKGTLRRQAGDPDGSSLQQNGKERAENIMVVDLVRNDLSKICEKGSVQVDELCGIYAFPQVFQMISTVSGELRDGVTPTDAIRATFPMGSMTGAPKNRVMELIERYELRKRGLFSGSVGYFSPSGDFDLNVVIRSVLYNASSRYLSFHTGSAITFASDPEAEYEECLLKAEAIRKALA